MPIETFPIGPLETNCHIVISGSDAVAVDPGGDLKSGLGEVLALLKEQNLTLRAILCTHFHFDHLYGVAALHEATGAPVYGPAGDASLLGTELGGSVERRARDDVHAVFRVERVGHVQFVAGVDVRIEQRGGRVERVVSARGPVVEAGLVQR